MGHTKDIDGTRTPGVAERFFKRPSIHGQMLVTLIRRVVLFVKRSRPQRKHAAVVRINILHEQIRAAGKIEHLIFIELEIRGRYRRNSRICRYILIDILPVFFRHGQEKIGQIIILSGNVFLSGFPGIYQCTS